MSIVPNVSNVHFVFFDNCGIMPLMKKVTAKYARQNFAEIINEVFYGKKKIVITRSGKPVVVVTKVEEKK